MYQAHPLRREDFAGTCPLVPGAPPLVSGSCSSPRAFGLGFLQTPPHGGCPCPFPSLRLREYLARGLAPRPFCTMPGTHAPGERRPTGTAPRRRTEPALWAVRSSGLIMREASPAASPRGLLALGTPLTPASGGALRRFATHQHRGSGGLDRQARSRSGCRVRPHGGSRRPRPLNAAPDPGRQAGAPAREGLVVAVEGLGTC